MALVAAAKAQMPNSVEPTSPEILTTMAAAPTMTRQNYPMTVLVGRSCSVFERQLSKPSTARHIFCVYQDQ
jgi:hypothetical protein